MLITVEGLDFCGKSTLISELRKHLPELLTTKEPGSPMISSNVKIREIVLGDQGLTPFTRELLFYADAQEHREWIRKQPEETLILSDRGKLTHFSYVYGYMKTRVLGPDGADQNYVRYRRCRELIEDTSAEPDAIIYLEGDLALMKERARAEKDAIELLGSDYFAHVLAKFTELIACSTKKLLKLDPREELTKNVTKALDFLAYLRQTNCEDTIER